MKWTASYFNAVQNQTAKKRYAQPKIFFTFPRLELSVSEFQSKFLYLQNPIIDHFIQQKKRPQEFKATASKVYPSLRRNLQIWRQWLWRRITSLKHNFNKIELLCVWNANEILPSDTVGLMSFLALHLALTLCSPTDGMVRFFQHWTL